MTEISGQTRVYAILADPVHHVQTPQKLNALMRARGHDGVMIPVHVAADDLETVVAGLKRMRTSGGFVVTVPHKTAIVALCDTVSRQAELVGAVNCVRREADGRLVGEILDGAGFVAGLRKGGHEPKGKSVLLLGAGGAANAIAFALAEVGIARLGIAARRRDRRIWRRASPGPFRICRSPPMRAVRPATISSSMRPRSACQTWTRCRSTRPGSMQARSSRTSLCSRVSPPCWQPRKSGAAASTTGCRCWSAGLR
jgi:Shikimate dehydrogenase substrate binding domain